MPDLFSRFRNILAGIVCAAAVFAIGNPLSLGAAVNNQLTVGDMNRDGLVTPEDLPLFLEILENPEADPHDDGSVTPDKLLQVADFNHDGVVDRQDLLGLSVVLLNQTAPAENRETEPATTEPRTVYGTDKQIVASIELQGRRLTPAEFRLVLVGLNNPNALLDAYPGLFDSGLANLQSDVANGEFTSVLSDLVRHVQTPNSGLDNNLAVATTSDTVTLRDAQSPLSEIPNTGSRGVKIHTGGGVANGGGSNNIGSASGGESGASGGGSGSSGGASRGTGDNDAGIGSAQAVKANNTADHEAVPTVDVEPDSDDGSRLDAMEEVVTSDEITGQEAAQEADAQEAAQEAVREAAEAQAAAVKLLMQEAVAEAAKQAAAQEAEAQATARAAAALAAKQAAAQDAAARTAAQKATLLAAQQAAAREAATRAAAQAAAVAAAAEENAARAAAQAAAEESAAQAAAQAATEEAAAHSAAQIAARTASQAATNTLASAPPPDDSTPPAGPDSFDPPEENQLTDGYNGPLLARDGSGWTVFSPHASTRIIYVSSSQGNDSNNGLSDDKPVKTLAAGYSKLRDGMPDWLLLKRGDVWSEKINWKKSGLSQSPTGMMRMGAYGVGPRPLCKGAGLINGVASPPNQIAHVAFTDLDVYYERRNPGSSVFSTQLANTAANGFDFKGDIHDILIEGCRIRFFATGLAMQPLDGGTVENIRLRRNVIANSYSTGSHAQGAFMSRAQGVLIEENVFDHNGWNTSLSNAEPTHFNHNMYLTKIKHALIRNNISARASSQGFKGSSDSPGDYHDVILEENLIIQNGNGTLFDQTIDKGHSLTHKNVIIRKNVYTQLGRVLNGSPQNFGIWLKTTELFLIEDNIFYDNPFGASQTPISTKNFNKDITVRGNVVHNWAVGNNFRNTIGISTNNSNGIDVSNNLVQLPESRYFDANRDVASYQQTINGTPSLEAFLAEAREQSKTNWRVEYTAKPVVTYIRQGFSLLPDFD